MQQANGGLCSNHFYPRPPRGGRPEQRQKQPRNRQHFYPRPPRGGRLSLELETDDLMKISIHALREEGDSRIFVLLCFLSDFYPRPPRGGRLLVVGYFRINSLFLSTPSARRATTGNLYHENTKDISIHALREEGDRVSFQR